VQPDPGPYWKPLLHWQAVRLILAARENDFAGQAVHNEDPRDVLYLPGAHATHAGSPPYTSPKCPRGHLQSSVDLAPGSVTEFAKQREHMPIPVKFLNEAVGQGVQTVPSDSPENPRMQVQSATLIAAEPEEVPAGQSLHTASLPGSFCPNFPTAQASHFPPSAGPI
jgi:hypothetical protein